MLAQIPKLGSAIIRPAYDKRRAPPGRAARVEERGVFGHFLFICFPTLTSHTLKVLSGLIAIIWVPSVVHWRSRITFLWPFKTMKFLHSPCTFQRKISQSWDPDAIIVPSGLNFME
ncbi:hypothetical protein LguiA_002623 [Lonicera macranthoides]